MQPADILGLPDDPSVPGAVRHNADIKGAALSPQLRAGYIFGSFEVDDLTIVFEIVEFPTPVRTEYKHIDVIFEDIADLLALVLLYDDLICKSCLAHIFDPMEQAVTDIELASLNVIALTGHTDDQIVAQCPRPFQDVVMTAVKQVKGSISNHSFHAGHPHAS